MRLMLVRVLALVIPSREEGEGFSFRALFVEVECVIADCAIPRIRPG